ncbi:MAG: MiaB/RimO family radical SAM methylthiotransferase [Marinifilaceae bacterium]
MVLRYMLYQFTLTQSYEQSLHTRSMIKIQDGCDNFCTFCIIPEVRGRAQSRPLEDILNNIRKVIQYGSREVVLTGVNIGRYEFEEHKFEDLLAKILELEGNFRVRISSIEPEGIGDKFYTLLNHPKLTPHLHLCLQSGSDPLLMRMRRMYNIKTYKEIVAKAKTVRPDFNFTTDVIVGFPGETDTDFAATCEIVKEIGFSHVHTFKYSIRRGTRAERMKNQVPEQLKNKRSELMREIAEKCKLEYRKEFIGKKQCVLVEKIKDGIAYGYGEHYLPVMITGSGMEKNCFYNVLIREIDENEDPVLIGELC